MVRDYHNQHRIVNEGGWNIADAVQRSMTLKVCILELSQLVEILDALRNETIWCSSALLDRHKLPDAVEKELN